MTEKEKQIKEWESKGAEWCAQKLWLMRNECRDRMSGRYNFWRNMDERMVTWELERANKCLEKLLRQEGIKTQQLTITYETNYCNDPQYSLCCEEECYDCICNVDTVITKRMSFYTWDVDKDGTFDGIQRGFKENHMSVVRIVDENSGTVLFERKQDEEED